MSMKTKKLYVAKNIEELQEKANLDSNVITNRTTDMLCKSSKNMLVEAQKKYDEYDEEKAFIFFFKFIELVMKIKQKNDFSSNPLSSFLTNSLEPAMTKATKLKASLSNRYDSLKLAEKEKVNEMERNSRLMNAEKDEPDVETKSLIIDMNVDHSITSTKLFSLMKAGGNTFLLLDVRPADDFEESHIKLSSCVNVPQEILIPGITCQRLEERLPTATLSKWNLKNTVDYVILLDWDTSETTLPPMHPLRTLEEAMIKWDRKNPLNKQPLILIGGYRDWLLRYPVYTTKALDVLSMEASQHIESIADFSSIVYPDLDGALKEELGIATVQNNQHILSRPKTNQSVRGWTDETNNALPSLNRITKPHSAPQSVHNNIKLTPKVENGAKPQTPEFNRDLKPPVWAIKTSDFTAELDEVETAAKNSLNAAQIELSKEQQFAQLRLKKELEAEESMRIELQKQEEILRENLRKLHEENKKKGELYLQLKEENDRMRKLLTDQGNEEQSRKERNIQNIDTKYRDMQKEVDRLRQERKLKEKEEAEAKAKSHSAGEFRTVSNESLETGKHSNDNNYRRPLENRSLSVEGTSRLTRSSSSPNIVQLLAEENKKKIPVIDRSSKPTFEYPTIRQREYKMRNLNPTYSSAPGTVTGLRNLGNTCYMNSIIQCLSNTKSLSDYFTNRHYESHIKKNNKQGTNGEIVHEFAFVVWSLWNGNYKSISPKDFKDVASRYIPMCKGYEQQDAHEFLVVLMDKLHGDLNQGRDIGPLPNLDSLSEPEATEKFWNHHKTKNISQVTECFEGYLKSTLTCLSCRKTSNSFEVFSCLSLPISSSRCTLRESIATFLKSERMGGEAAWDCPNCRQKKEAEKSLSFCKLPDILIIQLKRFSYEGMWRRKIQSLVEFPTRLDMRADRYYDYNLYGIVNHFGYLEGGHYTAYCKKPTTNKWYKFDDHEVSEISVSDIVTSAAYLLFYCKA